MKPITGLVTFLMAFGLMAFGLTISAFAQDKPNPLIGSHLYRAYCLVCHGKEGQGDGPLAKKMNVRPADLTSDKYQGEKVAILAEIIGRYRSAAESNMPNWGLVLPQGDVKHIASYLATLTRKDLEFRGNTRRGRMIFKNACLACHGKNGRGNGLLAQLIQIEMVDFTRSESMRVLSDRKLIETITEGKGDFMPSWTGTLNDDEIVDVAAYVRLLAE